MDELRNFKLSEQLKKAIGRLGFKKLTQIQKGTIPFILEGRDVIGESATGSGKTLAFGVGIIKECNVGKGVQAVVLVPTRELAEQVKGEMIKLAYEKPLKILAVYGGVAIGPQIEKLRNSEVVIATPGRMLDHLNRETIDVSNVRVLVLDEADRMVEMGFIEDVEQIIKACPKKRQTLLFSATMYESTKKIAQRYMKNPKMVHATKMVDPSKLKQMYYDVPSRLKRELLVYLLKKESSDLVMVFCNTRRGTDIVVRFLKNKGIKASCIHGGLNQAKRLKIIDMFHEGKFQILVCTDVAARGLHIEGVTHIYNFDIPKEPGDYVHRIGRTARAGKDGLVINILAYRDYENFSRLQVAHRDFDIQKVERPYLKVDESSLRRDSWRGRDGRGGRDGRERGGGGRSGRSSRERSASGRSGGHGRFSRDDRRGSRGSFRRRKYNL